MPKKSRESRTWLPDPLEGLGASGSPLLGGDGFGELGPTEPARQGDEAEPRRSVALGHIRQVSETGTVVGLGPPEEPVPAQPRHSSDTQSPRPRELADLPPQLRASVFFDLPQEPPKIEVKDGSATATLDSILDASAKAPVSAFVDHAFAGKLGAEVYGREKKPKKKTKSTVSQQARQSVAPESGGPKKRGSFLPLIGGRRNSDSYGSDPRRTLLGAEGDGEGRASSFHAGAPAGSDQGPESLHEHAPGQDAAGTDNRVADGEGEDDDGEEEEEEEEEENVYQGPPTTLLAELQIRKQQQKMRTRPVHKVNPNGLHTTLLELDTVAEVELKARKGKKVNLAWEDPTATAAGAADDEDEDVPLAMLYAAKAAAGTSGVDRSTRDITTLLNEINRPLGLMERWELEENEPLSRRRDRLQGRDPAAELHLDSVHKRMSRLTLNPGGIGARTQSRLMLPLQPPQPVPESIAGEDHAASEAAADPDPPEIEGETLAERRRRLQAETLPRPRPSEARQDSQPGLGRRGAPGRTGDARAAAPPTPGRA
ncbi:hypothetical protein VTK73DRAFT_4452 [Phialemonium thermophilum]|uniref:Uncharacterized protein n=1 Tax=Phialemonium thermophilum TaxID=223376 RepID=A0ABR3V922_9PEZI